MAIKVKLSKGPIQIQRGVDAESHEPIFIVSVSLSPKIHLGGNHHIPIPLSEGESRFTLNDLTPEAQSALKLLVAELEGKVLSKANEKAAKFVAETGIKIE